MPISVHLISNMGELLRKTICGAEGFLQSPENIGDHTITLGYGYTFIRRSSNGQWYVPSFLTELAAIGITLTASHYNHFPLSGTPSIKGICDGGHILNCELGHASVCNPNKVTRGGDLGKTVANTVWRGLLSCSVPGQ